MNYDLERLETKFLWIVLVELILFVQVECYILLELVINGYQESGLGRSLVG